MLALLLVLCAVLLVGGKNRFLFSANTSHSIQILLELIPFVCLFILLYCVVARHSRCALILFSVCGLLAVTGSWLMSGLYLSSSVAVGDLCMDPAGYLVSQAPKDLPTEVLLYYTQCESVRSNPFTLRLRESQNAINNARSAMNIVSR